MGESEEGLTLLAGDTRSAALANLREEVRGRLNVGAPRTLAELLFDLLAVAIDKGATIENTYISARLSRTSAANRLGTSVESGTFKNAVKRIEEVLAACRPDDYTLMPPEEDRLGVACVEAVIDGELHMLIVRGPTGETRRDPEPDPLLRLVAEFRPLKRSKPINFHWNLRQTRNFAFTGREDVFEALNSNPEYETARRIDILFGLGGVGKSHICVEYAYRHREDFDVIWWIRGTDTTTIEEDLRGLATDLAIADALAPTLDAVRLLRAWLERSDRWLLIFDNVDAPDILDPYLPAAGGRVLVTSLNPSWHKVGRVHEVVELSESDANLFLQRRVGPIDESTALLARELGYLPLALEQAAAYIEATGLTYADYLDLYRANRSVLLKRRGSHLSPVVVTWLISVENVQTHDPLAIRLLNIAAHMAAAPIPKAIFELWIVRDLDLTLLRLNDAIAALRRYSIINARAMDIVVHRLLQNVILESQKKHARRQFQATALVLTHDVFLAETYSFHRSGLAARLLPHIYAVTEPDRVASTTVAIHSLVGLASYLDQRGKFEEVADVLQTAAKRMSAKVPKMLQLSVLNKLTSAQWVLGRNTDAAFTLLRASDVNDKFEPKGPGEFESRVEFLSTATALALPTTDDPQRLLLLIQQAVDIAARVDLEPGMAARVYADKGAVLGLLGRHAEAIVATETAVKFDREMFGNSHPALALRLGLLALAYKAAGRLIEARTASEEALTITRNAYGADHTVTVMNCIRLADILRQQQLHAGALELYDDAKTRIALLTPEWTAQLLVQRAETLRALRRHDDARADFDQAIDFAEAMHFPERSITKLRDLRGQIDE
jgi:tetratricopeptide (TPR) repeat protein